MSIKEALKQMFLALTGVLPTGNTIEEVTRNGAKNVVNVKTLDSFAVKYEDATKKSLVLSSSTASSIKKFRITVTDDGVLTATEIMV